MYGVLLKAIHDYSDGKEPMPCLVVVPISTRKAFSDAEQFTIDNKTTALLCNLDFNSELEKCIRLAQQQLKAINIPGLADEAEKANIREA